MGVSHTGLRGDATQDLPGGRMALRAATAACHERVDELFSGLDLSKHDDYARFLSAQAAAFVPTETALERAGIGGVVPDWRSRRRSAALLADLGALGLAAPTLVAEPVLNGEAELLGALYVLEGSRLGGQMLKRSVPADFPTSFLSQGAPGGWRALTQLLDARLRTPEEVTRATRAAEQVFGLFEQAGRGPLLPDGVA